MSNEHHSNSSEPAPPNDKKTENVDKLGKGLSRRTFAKIGLGAAPVIMTLASRPALAGKNFCTISGWGSVHPSGRPNDHTCDGKSPGFWKTHWSGPTKAAWNLTTFTPGPTNPIYGQHDYSVPTIAALDAAVNNGDITISDKTDYLTQIAVASSFDDLMGGTTTLPDNPPGSAILRPTIMQVFHDNFYKQYLNHNAAFHFSASLLNADAWGISYGYTLSEMRNLIWQWDGGKGFIDDLEGLYDR